MKFFFFLSLFSLNIVYLAASQEKIDNIIPELAIVPLAPLGEHLGEENNTENPSLLYLLAADSLHLVSKFLDREEFLSLRFVSKRLCGMVKMAWNRYDITSIIRGENVLENPLDFAHRVFITENRVNFPYRRAQLSCVREYSFQKSYVYKLQDMINILPPSLNSLTLQINTSGYSQITMLNFPNLSKISLCGPAITLTPQALQTLPIRINTLILQDIKLDEGTCVALAETLKNMTHLQVLSLENCSLNQTALFSILKNLPITLVELNIGSNYFHLDCQSLPIEGISNLQFLQSIDFRDIDTKLALHIISLLPNCISTVQCFKGVHEMEILQALIARSSELKNIERINRPYGLEEMASTILESFPKLDEKTKKKFWTEKPIN